MRRDLVREVAELAWPAILQGLLTTVIFFTDRLLLGTYSDEALGSMQVSGPVLWSVFSVLAAFSAGTMAIIGRSVGAGDHSRVHETLLTVLALSAGIGTCVTLLALASTEEIASVMAGGAGTSDAMRSLSVEYMDIVFCVAPLSFMASSGVVALQAGGDTRSPMWISGVCGFSNLLVSWVLIFGHFGAPELGITGAAIGSVLAIAIQIVLVGGVLWRAKGPVTLRPLRRPTLAPLWPLLRVSWPTFGEKAIFHTGFLLFAGFVGYLGDVAMTANQSLIAIESLGFMISFGFGIASSSLVAQKLGAGAPDDAAICGWIATGMGALLLGGIGLFFLLFADHLVSFFSDDPEVVDLGATCLRIAAVAQPLMAITDALAGSLRGAGDTRSPMLVAIAGPIVVRVVACWFFAFHMQMGLLGIWIATTLDWLVRAMALAIIFYRGRWRSIVV